VEVITSPTFSPLSTMAQKASELHDTPVNVAVQSLPGASLPQSAGTDVVIW
jgi:hypothetical protein